VTVSPKDEAAQRTLAAITDLIVETARGDGASRFAEVGRLAQIAQSLKIAVGGRRVGDHPKPRSAVEEALLRVRRENAGIDGIDGTLDEEPGGSGAAEEIVQPPHMPLDSHAMLRNVMLMLNPVFQTMAEKEKGAVAAQAASELESLLHTRATIANGSALSTPELVRTIEERVARLVADMQARNKAHPPPMALPAQASQPSQPSQRPSEEIEVEETKDTKESGHVPVVSADDERRHPADGDERDDDLPPSLRPDPERGQSHGGSPRASALHEMAAQAVGRSG